MYLQIFKTNPVAGLSVLVCLATILWCTVLIRRYRSSKDRYLLGLIGLISVYQSLRVLRDFGIWAMPRLPNLDASVELTVSLLYLLAAVILRASSVDRANTKVRLRLVEANESRAPAFHAIAPGTRESARAPDCEGPGEVASALLQASPLAVFSVDRDGLVTYWNGAAERLFGWPRADILGRPLPAVLEAEDGATLDLRGPGGRGLKLVAWRAPFRLSSGAGPGFLTVMAELPHGAENPERAESSLFKSDLAPRAVYPV